jgi:hypothetical protein
MPQADANRVKVSYAAETTFGSAAVSGFKELPINSSRLAHAKRTVLSARLRSDRQVPGIIEVGANAEGSIPFELSFSDFNPFLAAAVGGTTSSSTITNGTTDTFFTLQEEFQDIGGGLQFTGMHVGTMSLNIEAEAIVTGEIGFVGKEAVVFASGAAVAASVASTNPIFNATANVGTLSEGGGTLSNAIRSLTININANRAPRPAVGHRTPIGVRGGRVEVTGSITAYFENQTLLNKFIQHTPTSLSVPLTDSAGHTITISIPYLFYSGGNPDIPGVNEDVMLTMDWMAQRDPSTGNTITFVMG